MCVKAVDASELGKRKIKTFGDKYETLNLSYSELEKKIEDQFLKSVDKGKCYNIIKKNCYHFVQKCLDICTKNYTQVVKNWLAELFKKVGVNGSGTIGTPVAILGYTALKSVAVRKE